MDKINLKKPIITSEAVMAFAENGAQEAKSDGAGHKDSSKSENAPKGQKSGLLPTGDVRLTANIREDLHLKLKIRAAQERTTIGELIERWIETW